MQGFLLNSTELFSEKGIFLNHHYNNFMTRKDKIDVKAYEVGFNGRTNNLKKVFGEFFEREILINNNNSSQNTHVATSLITGEKKLVLKSSLIAVDEFVDSCGMASHTQSNLVIKNAFLEFFERQSLIVSFLSKRPSERLRVSKESSFTHSYLLNFVDNVYYYNISLSPKIFVVLSLAIGKKKKSAGLGTSFNLNDAINKSQIEALQYFANDRTKIYEQLYNEASSEASDLYHILFDKMSLDEFQDNYSYLLTQEFTSSLNQNQLPKKNMEEYNFLDLLIWCNKYLKMNPFICSFPNKRGIAHLKIVKIFDENWFPHLNASLYSIKDIDNISKIIGTPLSKEVDWIPFP
ncbi:YcaO-like family protein [Kurthia sibirica]|uniref:YcaO domain-containing protein n=1 Tax=Kurthia sibirica TaxID=202750 RepID=A0A2U3AEN4_9BACL|nr:YcaO-like family protein [Kurthia sibirica]PWI23018.1 hypothetical protein DEX24_16515 [Kurthia sibirica]GEK35601.1 hypothetical protein KSI01_31340 [Kurthia sibirica]